MDLKNTLEWLLGLREWMKLITSFLGAVGILFIAVGIFIILGAYRIWGAIPK